MRAFDASFKPNEFILTINLDEVRQAASSKATPWQYRIYERLSAFGNGAINHCSVEDLSKAMIMTDFKGHIFSV
jgi:hypothetical protein